MALEGELRALRAERDAEKAAAKQAQIVVRPGGRETKLAIGGFVQTQADAGDVSAFEGRFPGGPNEIDDRLRVRRARVSISGDWNDQFDFKVDGEFQNADGTAGGRTAFSALDLFINWRAAPEAHVKVGQFKAPFGMEQLSRAVTLLTPERSLATTAITPDRQVGVQLAGQPLARLWPERADVLAYRAGVFNGNGRNITTNDNSEFMWAGRLEVVPFSGLLFGEKARLVFGANGFWTRDETGTNISPAGALRLNADGSLTRFDLPSPAERRAWGVDAIFTLGPLDLRAEFLGEKVRPRGGTPRFSEFETRGFYAQAAWFLVPEKLQLVGKWESFDPGQAADDDIRSLTGGLNYYIHGDDVKLMLHYIHTWSDFRGAHPESGGDQFDQVIARLQLMY